MTWAVAASAVLAGAWVGGAAGAALAGSEVGEMCRMRSAPTSPTMEALAGRISKAGAKGGAKLVSELLTANRSGFPLIEDSLVTLVYAGKVAVRACIPSDLNGWDTKAHEMQRLGEADLYYRTLALPPDARIDYKFYVDGAWMLDPLNPKTVRGGFGDNSAFAMPGYVDPWEIAPADSSKRGRIEKHEFSSKILGNTRLIQVYLPPHYTPGGSYPAIFVQDGGEYITLGSMTNVLANLAAKGLVPPVVAVFIDPVDRNYEYYLNPAYERMIVEEVLPFVREQYGVARKPSDTAIMGASLGGEISLMIALDHPEVFGKCGSQSGAFGIEEGKQIAMVGRGSRKPVDVYLDCGTFESLLESNRAMRDALKGKGYQVRYREFNEGHSWGNWRAHIDEALTFFWGKEP